VLKLTRVDVYKAKRAKPDTREAKSRACEKEACLATLSRTFQLRLQLARGDSKWFQVIYLFRSLAVVRPAAPLLLKLAELVYRANGK
jgi:hypothetical protein